MTTEQRLRALERRIRALYGALLGVLCVGGLLVLLGAGGDSEATDGPVETVFEEVRCERLAVVDEDGVERIILETEVEESRLEEDNYASLHFRDGDGRIGLEMGTDRNLTGIWVHDTTKPEGAVPAWKATSLRTPWHPPRN